MKIFKSIFFVVFFCTFFSILFSSEIYNNKNYLYETSLYLNTDLEVNYLINRLNDGWEIYNHDIGMNYVNDMTGDDTKKKYSIFSVFSMEAYLKLGHRVKAMADFDVYSAGDRSFWNPITDQNRKVYHDKEFISLKKAEVNLSDSFYHFRFFKGIGHYNWKYEGDMFDFYKEQFNTEKYLNISDRTIPEGVEIDYSFDYLGDLKVVYGEAMWGQEDSVYVKFNRKMGIFSNYIIYKREKTLWDVEDEDDEFQESYAVSTHLDNVFFFNLSLGAMYHPFRLNRIYEYEYNGEKKIDVTDKEDALGYAVRLYGADFIPIFDYTSIEGKYLGILAGNKQEYIFSFDKVLRKFFLNFKAGYRKPLEKANPLILAKNTEATYLHPRGEDSPFLVDIDNRELLSGDISLTYFHDKFNPSNIYLYENGKMDSWNLNREDNTVFTLGFNYNIKKYKGNTDLSYYTNEYDNIVWESFYLPGLLEPKYPLSIYSLFFKGRFRQSLFYNFLCSYGDSFATGSNAYVDDKFVSITQFLDMNLNLYYKNFVFIFKYGKDCWGYEDWHRFFGITYDNLYKYELSKDFGIFGEIGLSYLKVVQNKYKTEIIDIPSFEEFMLKWKYNFNRIYIFKEINKKYSDSFVAKKIHETNEILVSDRNSGFLTLNNDMINDKIVFDLDYSTKLKIVSWYIEIFDTNRQRVFKKEYRGFLPKFFEWDGTVTNKKVNIESGKYEVVFSCLLDDGIVLYSNKHIFYIYDYPSIMDTLSLKNIVNNKNIVLTKEGYKEFIFNYKLDKIYRNKTLDLGTLEVLLSVLKKEAVEKIKVSVYSDYGKSVFTDQKYSKDISNLISKYFVDKGIVADIIESEGYSLRDRRILRLYKDNLLTVSCKYHVDKIINSDIDDGVKQKEDFNEKIKQEIEKTGHADVEKIDILKKLSYKEIKVSTEILFRLGKYTLTKNGIKSLKKVVDDLSIYPVDEYDILLEGYTCNLGKASFNEELSLKRARNVANIFKELYGLKHRMLVVGRGETNPLFPNINELNRKKNRRIEISLIKKRI